MDLADNQAAIASIEVTPAMVAEDLQNAAPAVEQAVKDFG
jgi:hypothetical protein